MGGDEEEDGGGRRSAPAAGGGLGRGTATLWRELGDLMDEEAEEGR